MLRMTKRLVWVDRMRGLAILSVVVQHLTFYFQNEFIFHKLIGISNMALFFFISGFILETTAKITTLKESALFLLKKSSQLLLPFAVWTFFADKYFFQTEWAALSADSILSEIINPHLWFLPTLFCFSILFTINKFSIKGGGGRFSILFWGFIAVTLLLIWYRWGILKMSALYIIYFAAGTILSQNKSVDKLFQNQILATLALAIIVLCLPFWQSGATSMINISTKIAISFSVILIIYNLCTRLTWSKWWDKFILECGKFSLAIYVSHWCFLHIFDTKPTIVQNELLVFIPIFGFAILICLTCILFKKIVQLFPAADFLLFGEYKILNFNRTDKCK